MCEWKQIQIHSSSGRPRSRAQLTIPATSAESSDLKAGPHQLTAQLILLKASNWQTSNGAPYLSRSSLPTFVASSARHFASSLTWERPVCTLQLALLLIMSIPNHDGDPWRIDCTGSIHDECTVSIGRGSHLARRGSHLAKSQRGDGTVPVSPLRPAPSATPPSSGAQVPASGQLRRPRRWPRLVGLAQASLASVNSRVQALESHLAPSAVHLFRAWRPVSSHAWAAWPAPVTFNDDVTPAGSGCIIFPQKTLGNAVPVSTGVPFFPS